MLTELKELQHNILNVRSIQTRLQSVICFSGNYRKLIAFNLAC